MNVDLSSYNFLAAAPEITLLIVLGVVLLVDLFLKNEQRHITHWLTIIGIGITAAVQYYVGQGLGDGVTEAFGGMYIHDAVASLSKYFMYALVAVLLIYAKRYLSFRNLYQGEYYTLTLFALLGMSIMVSTGHLLALYLGLELLSLSLYAMIALRRHDPLAAEAALKYFVLGSLASGILLYGVSLIYGGSLGQLQLSHIIYAVHSGEANLILIKLGLIFVVGGVMFKLGAVPFHMWVPDVYHGSPLSVAAFVSSAPKIAAVVFGYRILVEGLGLNFADWSGMLQVLAVATLLVGNLAAIMQTNIKRMLAYSTISHMGFVLLAFVANKMVAGGADNQFMGLSSAFFYVFTYALMSLVAFGVLIALSSEERDCENISDLAGLNQRHPWYAFLMLLAMFSMAGIPPLMGFFAKFYVIVALLKQSYAPLAVYAVVMSLIGAFYYIRVVKVMYFDTPAEDVAQSAPTMCCSAKLLLSVNALLLIVFGVFPSSIFERCLALFM